MPRNPKRIGLFTRLLDRVSPVDRYRFATAQIVEAERHGFASAWVAQHHFSYEEGGLPAPLVFLASIAAKTNTIRLGTGIVTLPLEVPVRVAEDAAVLDIVSGGRLELGVGSGGTASSFAPFGHDSKDRGAIFEKHLDELRRALAGSPLAGNSILHPPALDVGERIWQATFSANGAARAGRAGDGLMLSRTQPRTTEAPFATLDDVQNPIVDTYLGALPSIIAPRILASRTLFVADDREEALRHAEIGLRRVADHMRAAGHRIGGDTLADLIKGLDTHVGTPEDVIESLAADTVLNRVTDIAFQVHSVDPPHELILRSIELIATRVAPALGWTDTDLSKPRLAASR